MHGAGDLAGTGKPVHPQDFLVLHDGFRRLAIIDRQYRSGTYSLPGVGSGVVVNLEIWNSFEVPPIAGDESEFVVQSGGRNKEIRIPDQ
jgi:hypothetical protein